MKVKDTMITNVKSIQPDTPVSQALDALSKNKISGLPVIDTNNTLVGYVYGKGYYSIHLARIRKKGRDFYVSRQSKGDKD